MVTKPINPVKRVGRRYLIEFSLSMIFYLAVMWLRGWLLHGPMRHADNRWQLAIALLPIIPVAFLLAAIVRCVLGMDEMVRRMHVESLAIAGAVTALLAVTYGLMESDRFPHLSAWWTYSTFMIAWLVTSFFVRLRYR